MLFDYHVKEMFSSSTVCFFFQNKQKRGEKNKQNKTKKAAGAQCEDRTALTESWHCNILYTLKERRSLGNRGGRQKGAEKHAGLSGFGINVKRPCHSL